MAGLLALSACQTTSSRKGDAQLLGRGMLAEVGHVVEVETVRGGGPSDPERPYRRATVLHDARVECDDAERLDASCGAVVEVFGSIRSAVARHRAERGDGRVARRGVYVLRVSPELDRDAARRYRQAFVVLAS